MKKAEALKHISRIDQEKKNQHGWWVRIHRGGRMIQKFFSDLAYRSRGGALGEAKKHRDALLVLYPKSPHGNQFNKRMSRNSSGIAGVHKTLHRKRGLDYDVWVAGWMLPDGKRQTRKFQFSPDGRSETEAKKLAIKARREGVALIKKLRAEKNEKRQAAKEAAKSRRGRRVMKR